MAQTIKLKRSATQGAVPTTSNLALGELAINTYDGKIFIKKNDGSESIVTIGALADNAVTSAKIAANAVTSSEVAANAIGTSEIAANSVGISELNVSDGSDGQVLTTNGSGTLSFTSKSASAQSFYLNTATGDGNTTGFTLSTTPASESYIIAFIDGVFQNQDSYTFSGTTLTFDTAPANGTTVTVYVVGSIYSGNAVVLDTFSGDDLETAFTLSEDPQSENNTQVYIDGVYQQKSEYSVSGQTITFSSAPPTGTNNIEVIAFTSTNLTVLNANSVTSASIASGAVNTSDIADNAITSAKIASGVIVASDVADNSITSAKIAANAVGASELASGALDGQTFTGDVTFNNVTVTDEIIGDIDGAIQTPIRNTTGSTIYKGQAVYVTGLSGDTPTVALARANSASTMPAVGIARANINNNATGQMTVLGTLDAINTSGSNNIETGVTLNVNDVLYISATEAGKVTNTPPTGESNLIQNLGRVVRVSPNTNMTFSVQGAGRSNAVPNLDEDQFFLGNASNQAVATDFSDAVEALSINNVVEDTTPQLGGDLDANGNLITFGDSSGASVNRLKFGDDSDLQLYHTGSASIVRDTGTGDLFVGGTNLRLTNGDMTATYLQGINGAAVDIRYSNAVKLATTSTGIDVTGEVLADSLDIDGNGDISGNLTLGGYLAGPSTFTIDPAAVGDNTGTVVIAGNFQVDGTTTTVNSTTITVDDKLLTLASGSINAAAANGGGIEIDITGSTNPSILYDGTNDEWDFNKDINVTGTVIADGLTVDTNTLYVDSTNNRVGIGTTSPAYQVEIENTGANALLVLDRTDGAACFIEGQATRSAFGSVGATPLALAYNSAAVVEIGANGAITVNPDGANPFTFPTSDGTNGQVLTTNGSGTLSFSTISGYTDSDVETYISGGTATPIFSNTEINGTIKLDGNYPVGTNNVALGDTALDSVESGGVNNTAIGDKAGTAITTGDGNTALGASSLESVVTGANNTSIGLDALRFNTASNNTAIGSAALTATTSGAQNTAIGRQAGQAITTSSHNTTIGYQSLANTTTGADNTALGSQALVSNTTASNNTAVGRSALFANTTGNQNTAVGTFALDANTTGIYNTAVGYSSLSSNVTGERNTALGWAALNVHTGGKATAVGYRALVNSTSSVQSTAIGHEALSSVTTGDANVGVGSAAGESITTGQYNTAVGTFALESNTTTSNNTAVGYGALNTNTADNNSAFGYRALVANTSGTQNTAIGVNCLAANTTGDLNTAIGYLAMNSNVSGANNVAVGRGALQFNTTSNNTAVGYGALGANTTGTQNNAFGQLSLASCTTGNYNCAFGQATLNQLTTGSSNIAMGDNAMQFTTTGYNNSCYGENAGRNISSGHNNTFIGHDASNNTEGGTENTVIGSSSATSGVTSNSQIVIGYSVSGTANNRVHIGNSSSHIYANFNTNATWTHSSDERSKKDIQPSTLGLEFINDLKPVTYKFKAPSEYPTEWQSYNADKTEAIDDNTHHGMIAQDVKAALDKLGIEDFKGWDVLPDGKQQISESMFVFPLIKAVQELSAKCDSLQSEINILKGE